MRISVYEAGEMAMFDSFLFTNDDDEDERSESRDRSDRCGN